MFATILFVRARVARALCWVAAATSAVTLAPIARAELIYGVTSGGSLITWDSAAPGVIISTTYLDGLAGDKVQGIDIRPSDGQLYALGKSGQLYLVNITTGQATQTADAARDSHGRTIRGGHFGFDFDLNNNSPQATTNANQNPLLDLSGNPEGATPATRLFYADGDPNAGHHGSVTSIAFANGTEGLASETLYGLDSVRNVLVTVDQSTGALHTVGSAGINLHKQGGFDISLVDGTAYAALRTNGARGTGFYQIDLATGRATLLGEIGGGDSIVGLTVAVPGPGALLVIACGLILFSPRRRFVRA